MAEKRFMICGGCGFIGSAFTHLLFKKYPTAHFTIVDLLTYAGSIDNLGDLLDMPHVRFSKTDISQGEEIRSLLTDDYDLVVNFAAETHVDRSLYYPTEFVQTNVLGVANLLLLTRESQTPLLHISTDEVYGPAAKGKGFTETAPLNPTSPYAASKASADLMVMAAIKTFQQNIAVVRMSNNYGPRQFPEKLIPYFIHLARKGEPLPLYGDGRQRRSWLHVDDFCTALLKLVEDFPAGEIHNIGSTQETTNLEIAELIGKELCSYSEIKFVSDRPAHDKRYQIDSSRFESRYGKIVQRDLLDGLRETIDWYLNNDSIFDRLKTPAITCFFDTHYRER